MYVISNGIWSRAFSIRDDLNNINDLNKLYLGYDIFNNVLSPCYLSQIKISNCAVYTNVGTTITPNYDLTPTTSSNVLFYLGTNYNDTITNTNLTINGTVNKVNRLM